MSPSLHDLDCLRDTLRAEMVRMHGPLLGGSTLVVALGLTNAAALRQARRRGHVAVALFTLPKRRGYFALTRDVADWLAQARHGLTPDNPSQEGGPDPQAPL